MVATNELQPHRLNNNDEPKAMVGINLAAPAIADPFTRFTVQGHPDALGSTEPQRRLAAPVDLAAHPDAGTLPTIQGQHAGELMDPAAMAQGQALLEHDKAS